MLAVAQGGEIRRHIFFKTVDIRFGDVRAHGHDIEIGDLQELVGVGLIGVQCLAFLGRQRRNRAGHRRVDFGEAEIGAVAFEIGFGFLDLRGDRFELGFGHGCLRFAFPAMPAG